MSVRDVVRFHGQRQRRVAQLAVARLVLACRPMPSMLHETLVFLFRNRPVLACEVLSEVLGIELPPHAAVRVEDSSFVPLVLGPGAVPLVTDVEVARRAPEMAVLSVLAHGKSERGLEVAVAATSATMYLDDDRNRLYTDIVYAAVNQAARVALEALVESCKWEYQSPYVKKWIRELAESKAEGKAEGKAEALQAILAARGLETSPVQREHILACRDLDVLDRWIARAVKVASVEEVLGH